jgi:hypothetical protein
VPIELELAPEPPFEPGIWLHWKGGKYLALWLSRSSENRNAFFVEYFSLEKGMHFSRPYASPEGLPDHERAGWTDQVDRDGYKGPRFRRLDVHPRDLYAALERALPASLWHILDPGGPPLSGSSARPDDQLRQDLFGGQSQGPYGEGR